MFITVLSKNLLSIYLSYPPIHPWATHPPIHPSTHPFFCRFSRRFEDGSFSSMKKIKGGMKMQITKISCILNNEFPILKILDLKITVKIMKKMETTSLAGSPKLPTIHQIWPKCDFLWERITRMVNVMTLAGQKHSKVTWYSGIRYGLSTGCEFTHLGFNDPTIQTHYVILNIVNTLS